MTLSSRESELAGSLLGFLLRRDPNCLVAAEVLAPSVEVVSSSQWSVDNIFRFFIDNRREDGPLLLRRFEFLKRDWALENTGFARTVAAIGVRIGVNFGSVSWNSFSVVRSASLYFGSKLIIHN